MGKPQDPKGKPAPKKEGFLSGIASATLSGSPEKVADAYLGGGQKKISKPKGRR